MRTIHCVFLSALTACISSEEQPAFYHSYQYVRGSKLGVIKINPVLAEKLEADPLASILHPRLLPMIIKPRIWQSHNEGCYTLHQGLSVSERVLAKLISF